MVDDLLFWGPPALFGAVAAFAITILYLQHRRTGIRSKLRQLPGGEWYFDIYDGEE